jgi:hypothetical protein
MFGEEVVVDLVDVLGNVLCSTEVITLAVVVNNSERGVSVVDSAMDISQNWPWKNGGQSHTIPLPESPLSSVHLPPLMQGQSENLKTSG